MTKSTKSSADLGGAMIAGLVEKLEAATMPAREAEVVVAESRRDTCRQIMRLLEELEQIFERGLKGRIFLDGGGDFQRKQAGGRGEAGKRVGIVAEGALRHEGRNSAAGEPVANIGADQLDLLRRRKRLDELGE